MNGVRWLLIGAGCLGPLLHAQSSAPAALLALSKADRTLAIVDPVSLSVLARVPSGPDPHEVVASADGRSAYISNYGFGRYHTLTIVDLVARKTLPPVDLGALAGPHGLAFVAGKVWFTAEPAKAIGRFDPASMTVDFVLGTGQDRTHMIWVAGDGERIVTSNVNSATMSIIERVRRPTPAGGAGPGAPPAGPAGGADWSETVVPVGRGAEGFDVAPGAKELWAANALDGTISIVSLEGRRVTETLAANVVGANRLKFTPDGRSVLVSTLRGPDVVVFDASSRREVKRVRVGRGAAGIQMQPDGARAFVACSPDDYVAVIDLKTLEMVGRIDVGKTPDGLAWAVARR